MIPVSRLIPAKESQNERKHCVMAHSQPLRIPILVNAFDAKLHSVERA